MKIVVREAASRQTYGRPGIDALAEMEALVKSLPPPIQPWKAPDGQRYYVFDKDTGRPLTTSEVEARIEALPAQFLAWKAQP